MSGSKRDTRPPLGALNPALARLSFESGIPPHSLLALIRLFRLLFSSRPESAIVAGPTAKRAVAREG